jgi:hypothetical protein
MAPVVERRKKIHLVADGIWSVFSYAVANGLIGGKSNPIPGDYGLECSVCHEQDRWDRLLGVCYGKCWEDKP